MEMERWWRERLRQEQREAEEMREWSRQVRMRTWNTLVPRRGVDDLQEEAAEGEGAEEGESKDEEQEAEKEEEAQEETERGGEERPPRSPPSA